MRAKFIPAAVLLCLALALTACTTAAQKPPEAPGRQEKVIAGRPSPERVARVAVKKEFLTVNGIEIREGILKDTGLDVRYPQIDGLLDQKVRERINTDIRNSVEVFVGELAARHQDVIGKQAARGEAAVSAGYGVHGNYNNVLSISECFNIHVGGAWEGWIKTYTYSLETGQRLGLADVFSKDANYRSLVNSVITEQILRENIDETSMSRPFEGVKDGQEFLVGDSDITICFNPDSQWHYSLHPVNFEFRIPFSRLEGAADIFDKYASPSGRLYASEKLKKKWLPNDLEIVLKKLSSAGDGYRAEASYVEIRGIENRAMEGEINRMLEERAREFVNDKSFLERAVKTTGKKGELPFKARHINVRGNFAGKLCLLQEDHVFIPNGKGEFSMSSYCFDLEKGRPLTMKDLLGKYPEYRAKIVEKTKKRLRERGLDPALAGDFETLAAKTGFFFDENMIFIYFKKGMIPREDFFSVDIQLSELGEDAEKIFE